MKPNAIDETVTDQFAMYHGDNVDVLRGLPPASVDFGIWSPPFSSLYTYSASERDMGNARDDAEFFAHHAYLIAEVTRVVKPGRLIAMHVMNLPTSKARDGFIGIRDFRGEMIRRWCEAGWIFHSEVCIRKDPVTAMQRTKAKGLLWKQLRADSSWSRQGIPDYLVVFRKPGDNPEPIRHTSEEFPVETWQRWAEPVWMDIDPSDTLQYRAAREQSDERHICPLQLEVIRRAVVLWSNPGDVVLSPFAGIGSEGYVAMGGPTRQGDTVGEARRFVGVELKESYYKQACRNLAGVERVRRGQGNLFASLDAAPDAEGAMEEAADVA